MVNDKLIEMKEALQNLGEKFAAELKAHKFEVKDWNVAIGKAGEATTLKISFEIDVTSKKK